LPIFLICDEWETSKQLEVAMLAVQNTIGIKLGNVLQGSAEGPLGIGALLAIAVLFAAIFRRRR
jgi:uncharacterized protein (TIGR03382 family)